MSMVLDIATYLDTQGLGDLGTDIFYSYAPGQKATGIFVLDTGGPKPDSYIPTKNPTFQVFIRAARYVTGKALLDQVRAALHQLANTTMGSTYFYYILATSEGGHIGPNEAGQDEFSINFQTLTR
jgi:hypothetical protein